MLAQASGVTAKHLNVADVKRLPFPVPNLSEQREIASVLDACDTQRLALKREVDLLDEAFRALLEELMMGRLSALPLVEAEVAVKSGVPA